MFGVGSSLFLRLSAEFGPLVHDIQTQINNSSAKVVVPRESDTIPQVTALHLAGLCGLPGTYPRLYQSRYRDQKVLLHEKLTPVDLKHFKFFTGCQFVHWVVDREYAATISEAVILGTYYTYPRRAACTCPLIRVPQTPHRHQLILSSPF